MELRFYRGETDAWHAVAKQLTDLVSQLPAFNGAIASYAIAQCGTFLAANRMVERTFARTERVEHRWDFGALAAFGSAVRASYWFQRGRLDIARDCLERALERSDVYIAQAAAATVGPLLALALGDEILGGRCIDDAVLRDAREDPITPDDALSLGAHAAWSAAHGRREQAVADARRARQRRDRGTAFHQRQGRRTARVVAFYEARGPLARTDRVGSRARQPQRIEDNAAFRRCSVRETLTAMSVPHPAASTR